MNANEIINKIRNANVQELAEFALLYEYRNDEVFAELLKDDYMAYLMDRYYWEGCENDAYFNHITERAKQFFDCAQFA